MSNKLISSLIPIRASSDGDFDFYAKRLKLRKKMDLGNIDSIVIDDGSPKEIALKIELLCKDLKFKYVRIESVNFPFSLSRARNTGVAVAETEWVVMEDADIIYESSFYQKLLKEVDLIDITPFNFLTIPVIYLKEDISNNIFLSGLVDDFIPEILTRLQFESLVNTDNNMVVDSFAPATALFVVRKSLINLVGGYDEYFVGWGGEDRDLAFRMLAVNQKNQYLPESFEITKNWNLNHTYDYEGWRAFYRLTGDYLANKGLYGFHLYHPKLEWREKNDTSQNINFAKEKALSFYKNRKFHTKYDSDRPVQIIIGYNPYLINDYVTGLFDNLLVLDDDRNIPYEHTLEKINSIKNVDYIIFWNPYGTSWKLSLYHSLKKMGYKTVVAERGALPNTYYFDSDGFCIESNTYAKFNEVVQNNKSDFLDKKNEILDYILNLKVGSDALEKQSDRIPVGLLRLRLNIETDKKILFCPLQLSTDTVTNYYVEDNRGYKEFLEEIKKLSALLPNDWVMVIKNHPLSNELFNNPKVIIADDYHINDLIEASSAVALFNSGCGLISMAFEKKVYYYGKCFYAIDGVNAKFESAEALCLDISENNLSIDFDKVLMFYYFLLYHFYSIAYVKNDIDSSQKNDKNILRSIDYKVINFPFLKKKTFRDKLNLDETSLLMGRFGKSLYLKKIASSKKMPPVVKKKPALANKNIKKTEIIEKNIKQGESTPEKGILLRGFTLFISPFLNSKKKNKLKNSPKDFFEDSKSDVVKKIGNSLIK